MCPESVRWLKTADMATRLNDCFTDFAAPLESAILKNYSNYSYAEKIIGYIINLHGTFADSKCIWVKNCYARQRPQWYELLYEIIQYIKNNNLLGEEALLKTEALRGVIWGAGGFVERTRALNEFRRQPESFDLLTEMYRKPLRDLDFVIPEDLDQLSLLFGSINKDGPMVVVT